MDVKIAQYSMLNDFGLHLLSVDVGTPEIQENLKEIEGRNGPIDMSDAITGYPTYKNRSMKFQFDFKDGSYDEWLWRVSDLRDAIHGRRLQIIIGADSFYYIGRISVDTEKLNQDYSKVELSVTADPYKYELYSSLEDYEWDTFNFENGIVREYSDIQVTESMELTVPGRKMQVIPVFYCSAAMTVEYSGVSYNLSEGWSKHPDILLMDGNNILKFIGNGTVSVDYRGGRL